MIYENYKERKTDINAIPSHFSFNHCGLCVIETELIELLEEIISISYWKAKFSDLTMHLPKGKNFLLLKNADAV